MAGALRVSLDATAQSLVFTGTGYCDLRVRSQVFT